MQKIIFILILLCASNSLLTAQPERLTGEITYVGQENLYARFISTESIQLGDTIFLDTPGSAIPAFIVAQKSSTSVVGKKITEADIKTGTKVNFSIPAETKSDNKLPEKKDSVLITPKEKPAVSDSIPTEKNTVSEDKKQDYSGRISLTANSNIYKDRANYNSFRTSFSFNLNNLNNSPFSFSTYMIYRHRYGIDQQQKNFFDDYKIFSLAANYQKKNINVWLGRRINNYVANIGAIDGVQGDYALGKWKLGAFGGSRPDFNDYSFNFKLIQYGVYLAHEANRENGYLQSSLAFANQLNAGKTDRQFIYFQHNNNNLIKNVSIFLSSELDLYSKIAGVESHKLSLTSLYVMLRYRILKNLSVSTAYDNRRNIIYYESYQFFIDQLLAQETRQGFRLQLSYSPFKRVNINTSAFFRYQGSNPTPATNYYGSLSFYRIPTKNSTLSLNVNLLNTDYHKASIYGGRITQQIFKSKGQLELNYRNVSYSYFSLEDILRQDIAGLSFSYNLLRYTMAMLTYEGTFEKQNPSHRFYITLVQRFKSKKK